MNLAAWAKRNGVARVLRIAGSCRAVAGTGAEGGAADSGGRPVGASRATLTNCGVCAVSSADQKADLDGQVAGNRVGHDPADPGR
jgi:hypothetical protein